ncbi:hypothetical protein [Octadecabacter antarcticus]|uniref:hypothetical protein n=1 Tax=Octadecabacter antarcticus TaxID=1217908 RepID=UPI0001806D45|nr:hypothetical protein [Octadecabacter antarcticus]
MAVKVHDCIVFAADSASTLTTTNEAGEQSVLNVYNNADKVFNLHRELPLVAMTAGMGHIGGRSISSLAKELRVRLTKGDIAVNSKDYTVSDVVKHAHGFLKDAYEAPESKVNANDYLEFWIGGYGSTNEHGEIWKLVILAGQLKEPLQLNKETDAQCIYWGGQGSAISRLLLGVDSDFIQAMMDEGVQQELSELMYEKATSRLETPLLSATMPVIDVIRLAEFLVETTKGYFSFAFGSDIVGGATDLATVTKYEGFKWIKRKHFYPRSLNRGDNDHVR